MTGRELTQSLEFHKKWLAGERGLKISFLNEDLELLTEDLPSNSKDALWKILSIVQDFLAEKESEKVDIEEEIKRIRIEIDEMLEVLKITDEKGKRER